MRLCVSVPCCFLKQAVLTPVCVCVCAISLTAFFNTLDERRYVPLCLCLCLCVSVLYACMRVCMCVCVCPFPWRLPFSEWINSCVCKYVYASFPGCSLTRCINSCVCVPFPWLFLFNTPDARLCVCVCSPFRDCFILLAGWPCLLPLLLLP